MKDTKRFYIDGEEPKAEPLHYRACGLEDIYLLNGFTRETTDYGDAIAIHNIDGLHVAIGLHLVCSKKPLGAKEFRFLRNQMDMTQLEIANLLGVDVQTVARWEKAKTNIPGPADRAMRFWYVFELLPEAAQKEVIEEIKASISQDEDAQDRPAVFKETDEGWVDVEARS